MSQGYAQRTDCSSITSSTPTSRVYGGAQLRRRSEYSLTGTCQDRSRKRVHIAASASSSTLTRTHPALKQGRCLLGHDLHIPVAHRLPHGVRQDEAAGLR